MKKIIALALAAMMVLSLAACGGAAPAAEAAAEAAPAAAEEKAEEAAPAAEAAEAAPAAEKKDKYTIAFTQTGTESEWVVAMSDEIIKAFEDSDQFELLFSECQNVQENQIKAIRSYIQQGVDGIVIRPTVSTGWDAVLMEAKEAGIPVIFAGRNAEMAAEDIEDYRLCYIGPDNVYAGGLLVQTMLDTCKDLEAPVNIVVLEGTTGSSAATERNQGIEQEMAKQDKLVLYGSQDGNFTRTEGKEVMEAFLKSAQSEGVDIKGVLCENDDMGLGAIQAIEEAGLKPGQDIFLMGVDGARGSFEAMAEGKYNATIENPLGYGPVLVDTWTDYFNGTNPEKWIKLFNTVYLQEEAAELLPTRTW